MDAEQHKQALIQAFKMVEMSLAVNGGAVSRMAQKHLGEEADEDACRGFVLAMLMTLHEVRSMLKDAVPADAEEDAEELQVALMAFVDWLTEETKDESQGPDSHRRGYDS